MFELTREALERFTNPFTAIITEVKLVIDEDGLRGTSVDPAHVAMTDNKIYEEAFDAWEMEPDEFGIDLEKVEKFLSLVNKKDVVQATLDRDESQLVLKSGHLTRKVPLLDPSGMTEPNLPDLDWTYSFTAGIAELKTAMKAAKGVGDHVLLSTKSVVDGKVFDMTTTNRDDEVEVQFDNCYEYHGKDKDAGMKSRYAVDYLSDMIKSIKPDTVDMEAMEDYPMKMTFEYGDGEIEGKYLLAPRIESGG